MSKYKVGDKFVIEIDKHMTNKDGDLYGVKPFKAMVMDDYGLDQLTPYKERDCPECQDEWQDRVDASFDDGYKHGYNEGLTRAWLFVKALADMPDSEGNKIFGNLDIFDIVDRYTAQDAIKKYEDYIKEQEEAKRKAEEEIKVGDELCLCDDPSIRLLITNCGNDGKYAGISNKGFPYYGKPGNKWRRTGRHFDIYEILEFMSILPHDPSADPPTDPCGVCRYTDRKTDEHPCTLCIHNNGGSKSYYREEDK